MECNINNYLRQIFESLAGKVGFWRGRYSSSQGKAVQAVWDSAPDGYLVSLGGVITACNGAALALFGVTSRDDLIGRSLTADWPSPEVQPSGGRSSDLGRELFRYAQSLKPGGGEPLPMPAGLALRLQGDAVVVEWVHQRRDGQTFVAESFLTPMAVDGGMGFLVIVRDISLQKRAEQDMLRAKGAAEEMARIKSDFLANMSHEIRTPMNAIIGLSHLALKTGLTARQRDYLEKIEKSGQHLLGVINDILDFSKIESGKLNVEHAEFELERLLDNLTNLIGDRVTAKGLELIFDVAVDVPIKLMGDSLRLGQILLNYANNAVKFTDMGEINIAVRKVEETPADVVIRFSVSDTGTGIDRDVLDRLFQGFQQADISTTRKHGGTGLGLVISKKLAQLMGGEVGVDSQLGQGSTFWFTARLGKTKRPQRALVPSLDLRGQRVLVVDDNEHARTVLSGMLIRMSFEVEVVDSGAAALAVLRDAAMGPRPYVLVFLDWRMPGMDGSETVRHIRALDLKPQPRCIMVTAYGHEQVIRNAQFAGVDDLVMKPVNPSHLFDTVMRVFAKDAEGVSVAPKPAAAPSADMLLASLRGAKVLLVEDNEINQLVATELLVQAGFEVVVADNGAVALAKVMSDWFDVVLMDMQMPVMDGLAATREIRRVERLSRLPIIAMTANAMAEDRARCLAAGMNDFVTKPIQPEALWRTLVQWVTPRVRAAYLTEDGRAHADHVADAIELLGQYSRPGDNQVAGAAGDQPGMDDLPYGIEGLDVAQGVQHMLGNRTFYAAMLGKFVEDQASVLSDIGRAIDVGDMTGAERFAHTLKGLAGSLGAVQLFEHAQRLEAMLRTSSSPDETRRVQDETAVVFNALIVALQSWLANRPALATWDGASAQEATQRPGQAAEAREVLQLLLQLLNDNDSEALEVFQEHDALLRDHLGACHTEVSRLIQSFDFDAAIHILAPLMPSAE